MSGFFIRRPIVAIVISIVTVLAGLVAMRALPIAQFPEIIPPQISVTGTYTGADALTIESAVAAPLEQQMNGVDNMLYMQSTNANDGTVQLTVTFDVATDPSIDQVNVQNRVAQAQPNLPPDVNTFGLTMRKATGFPMLIIGLSSPAGTYDALFLANYANINIIDALYRVPGVGDVRIFGANDYAMRIWVKPDRLATLGLTVPDVVRAVQQQSTVNPSGQIGAQPAPSGQEMTYTVRAQGRLQTPEEFAAISVRSNPDGSVVRLKDVARIELGALNYQQIGRVNGQPGCAVAVFQTPGSNALEVADGVKQVMTDLQTRFPEDLEYRYSVDTTLPVSEGIREILITLTIAIVLVMIVVYLFLQNWRATLIPMIAVPVSLIGTFAVFPLLGFSINTLSLFGLVLAIGLVVDDAIVVVEAVEHHIEEGMTPRDATVKAMQEVSGPVVSIALILSSVFIPVGFLSGIQGRLNKQFAITIAISVIISAFNALTLSPALAALLLRPRAQASGWAGRFFAMFNRGFGKATNGYVRVSHALVRRAVVGVLLLLALSAATVLVGRRLPTSFVPEEDYGYLLLNVQLPPAASLERTDAVCRKIDELLAKTEGVANFNTIAGFSLLSRVTASNYGFYFVGLKPWDERTSTELDARHIVDRLNRELRRVVPEATAFAVMPPSIPGLGTQGGFSFWLQDRSGGTLEFLNENVQKVLDAARQRPELTGVTTQFTAAVPQLYANVDRDKVLKQGIALGDVYQTMQAFLGGLFVNQFNRFGRQWRVFLQAEGADRTTPAAIQQFYVRNNDGSMVPLSALETTTPTFGPQYTNRFNVYRGGADHRCAGTRVQLRTGTRRARGGGAPDAAARDRLRLVGPFLSGKEGRRIRAALRAVDRVRLPDSCRALRELDAAVLGAPVGAGCGVRRHDRAVHAALRLRRLRANRRDHADRAGREERDPDRRVREGAAGGGDAAGGCGARRSEAAAAPDYHDVVRLHPRMSAALVRQRIGRRVTADPRHRGGGRDADGDAARRVPDSAPVRAGRAIVEPRCRCPVMRRISFPARGGRSDGGATADRRHDPRGDCVRMHGRPRLQAADRHASRQVPRRFDRRAGGGIACRRALVAALRRRDAAGVDPDGAPAERRI